MCVQVNPNIRRDKWTEEEDAKLIELVKTFGVGRWAEIARNCDGRTDQQCMGRWRRHLDPSIRRVSDCGERPNEQVAWQQRSQLPTKLSTASPCLATPNRPDNKAAASHKAGSGRDVRTPCLCDPSRLLCVMLLLSPAPQDSWSAEEDAKLRQLHAQYGTSWSRISKNLKGRTSQQCRARWHQINNTRSKSCGSGGADAPVPAAAVAGGSSGGGRQAVSRLAVFQG